MFKYDLHVHTSETSKCANNTAWEMIEAYHIKGYTGVVITDHFVNGHCRVDTELPWVKQMNDFLKGYRAAKVVGDKLGVQVFLGWEYAYNGGEDYLTLGLEETFLFDNPDVSKLPINDYCKLVKKNGGFIIQAHPYRKMEYMGPDCQARPQIVDAFEVFNATPNHEEFNAKALAAANEFNIYKTAGADAHHTFAVGVSGIAVPRKADNIHELITMIKGNEATLIENYWVRG